MTPDADPSGAWEVLRWIFDKLWILLAAGFAVLRAKLRSQDGAIDEVRKSVQAIQADYVSRPTFNQRERDWRDEIREWKRESTESRKETRESIKELITSIDAMRARIDKLVDK